MKCFGSFEGQELRQAVSVERPEQRRLSTTRLLQVLIRKDSDCRGSAAADQLAEFTEAIAYDGSEATSCRLRERESMNQR